MSNKFVSIQKIMSENLTHIVPPIEFPCTVNGKRLTAKITHEEDNPINFVYHVSFSDGYKSSFHSIEHELGFYEDGKGNSDYVKGIRADLKCICGFSLDRELYCLTMDESGEGYNVWIKQDDDSISYSIYSAGLKNHFRFKVKKTDKGWIQAHPNPKHTLTKADDALAAKVCKLIDSCRP
jgi:hypothetical protein